MLPSADETPPIPGSRSAVGATALSIGPWTIEPDLGRLSRQNETPRQLEPKVMELLIVLAREPGRVWAREDLEQQIWNGAYMAPGALKHLVWQLRKDLDDDAKAPRFVETIARKGYRWVPESESTPSAETNSTALRRDPAVSRAVWVVLLAASLGFGGLLWLVSSEEAPVESRVDPPPRATPLTALPGNEMGPAASIGGGSVVFAWDGGHEGEGEDPGGFDLYRQVGVEGTPQLLVAGPEDEFEPALSPDGRQVAFLRGDSREGGRRLDLLEVESGATRTLWSGGLLLDIVWHPEGLEIIASVRPPGSLAAHLERIPIDGSAPRFLTDPRVDGASDLFPAVSPEGQQLAFYRRGVGVGGEIILRDLETGSEQVLTDDVGNVVGLTFDPDGTGLVISSDRVPPRGLWWLPLDGGEARWLGLEGSFATDPTFGADGQLIYQSQQCDSNVWSYELAREEEGDRAMALPHLASTRQDQQPRLSFDGRWVAYLSSRTGRYDIWIAELPTGEPRRLTTSSGTVLSLAWSPDGERLAFVGRTSEGSAVSVVPVDGVGREQRLSKPSENALNPNWSIDGQSLYYSVKLSTGWTLYRHRLSTGEVENLGPGFAAKEDPLTGGLWRIHSDRTGLWHTSTSGEELRIAAGLRPIDAENWDTVPEGVVFAAFADGGSRRLMRWNRASGTTEVLGTLERNLPYPPGLSASRDGVRVLWTRLDSVGSDLLAAPWEGIRRQLGRPTPTD